MTKSNSVKNKISNEYRIVLGKDLSKLLAEFFNGEVIQAREECTYES